MQVFVNGAPHDVEAHCSVAELLERVSAPSAGVAVEVNREIVRRVEHQARCLNEGDRVEIVGLVGGG